MSKRTAIHYDAPNPDGLPQHHIPGQYYQPCMDWYVHRSEYACSRDVDAVTCRNCQRTQAYRDAVKAKEDLTLKSITAKPVLRPHYWIEVCGIKFHGQGHALRS